MKQLLSVKRPPITNSRLFRSTLQSSKSRSIWFSSFFGPPCLSCLRWPLIKVSSPQTEGLVHTSAGPGFMLISQSAPLTRPGSQRTALLDNYSELQRGSTYQPRDCDGPPPSVATLGWAG